VDWPGVDWLSVDWLSVDWLSVDWSGVDWSGVDWSGVDWSGVDWKRFVIVREIVDVLVKPKNFDGQSWPRSLIARLPAGC